jgi:hypothetical protein
MSRRRFIVLLVGALVAICGALYLSSQRNLPRDTQGASLLPSLAPELNTVTEVSVRKGSATPTVTVHRVGEQWSVAQRGDYPADATKLRRLLLGLSDAKIVEEKTSNPANFSIIGVEDPTQTGASGAEVAVTAQDGKHAVIVGKPVGQGNFARRAGENKSYLVEPAISVEAEPRSWIDSRLIDVPAASIQSVEIKPATGAGYVLRRLKPNEEGFALEGAPAGRKALDAKALAPSATTLSGLTAEDVAAVTDIDFSKPTEAVLTLSDGGVITLTGVQIADKRWIQVKSTKDAALAAKTQRRAFEIASYRYDAIFRPLDQLLVPKESKVPAKPASAGHKPATGAPAPARRSAPAPAP